MSARLVLSLEGQVRFEDLQEYVQRLEDYGVARETPVIVAAVRKAPPIISVAIGNVTRTIVPLATHRTRRVRGRS